MDSSVDKRSSATMKNGILEPFKTLPILFFPSSEDEVTSGEGDCTSTMAYWSLEFTATAKKRKKKNYTITDKQLIT